MNIRIGWCVFLFLSVSAAIIIIVIVAVVVVCQPLGSKAFYFIYECVLCIQWKCVLVCALLFFLLLLLFHFLHHICTTWKCHLLLKQRVPLNDMCECLCAPLYKLNVIEIVILPIEIGRRPILLGHTPHTHNKWLYFAFFSLCANRVKKNIKRNETYANSFRSLPFKYHENNIFCSLILT